MYGVRGYQRLIVNCHADDKQAYIGHLDCLKQELISKITKGLTECVNDHTGVSVGHSPCLALFIYALEKICFQSQNYYHSTVDRYICIMKTILYSNFRTK